jgi:hypothetical protein
MVQNTSMLEKEGVIPDVLPPNSTLSYNLVVRWPNATLDEPGKELDREATQPEPTLHLVPAVLPHRPDFFI